MRGCYVLIINIHQNKKIQIGRLGLIYFKKGFYVYVGSALNSLEKRIMRHKKTNKKLHWHIDYLLKYGEIIDIFYKESVEKEECKFAKNFKELNRIDYFGCSDCKCKSHLFFGKIDKIRIIIKKLELKKFKTL
jgi:Uri superfamily endonuclease